MPHYVSIGGIWKPAKERAVISDNVEEGQSPVYEGPDRAATEELQKAGVDHFGEDCRMNQDLRKLAANYGYSGKDGVDKYLLEMHGINFKDLVEKGEKEIKTFINTHKPKARKKAKRQPSGGDDTSGSGKHKSGGFGDTPSEQ